MKKQEINLEFEDEEDNPYNKIKSEYNKKRTKFVLYFLTTLIIIIIQFAVIYPIYLIPDETVSASELDLRNFPLTINWAIFSVGIFLIFYFVKELFMKITPLLKIHLTNEINNIGFKIQEKRNSWILFLSLISPSLILLILIELKIIHFYSPILNMFVKSIVIFYLIVSISIPVIWRVLYDGLIIKLKGKYKIFVHIYFKVRKIKPGDQQLIGIYLTSNKLANKFSFNKKRIYTRIVEERWLPRRRKTIVSKHGLSPFLRFHEFSTPSNLQKQFLNIVIALQEWDIQAKHSHQKTP